MVVAVKLKDPRVLARLMAIDGVTHRELAKCAGYRSHSYIGRLLRGERSTLAADAACAIAERLNVPVGDIFYTKVRTKSAHGAVAKRSER